jgi:hypothetical protein
MALEIINNENDEQGYSNSNNDVTLIERLKIARTECHKSGSLRCSASMDELQLTSQENLNISVFNEKLLVRSSANYNRLKHSLT